jgi:pSer/pThr/pTyr-binding forkhead associated (FHA) protein
VDRFPLRIGRSLENDLVLADPYVSPLHLIIDDGGDAWMLIDLGSENGTFVGRGDKLSGPMCAGSGDRITIGKTILRLWSSDHPVEPTLHLPSPRGFARRAVTPAAALASLIITSGIMLLQQRLDTEKQTSLASLIAGSIPFLTVPLLWAGLWAVAGFIVRRTTRFSLQLLVGNSALLCYLALSILVEYIDYATGNVAVADAFQYAGDAVLSMLLLFISITLAGGAPDLRRIVVSVIVGGGVVAAIAVSEHAESGENRLVPVYSHTLKPLFGKLSPASSLDQFIGESGKIFRGEGKPAAGGTR